MIRVPSSIFHAMIEHAKRESPLECCGILSGKGETVEKAFELKNAEESSIRYSMAPQDQLKVFEEMEKTSFTRPLEPGNIMEKVDRKLFMSRTEVRSKNGGSHLGHVFPDGPKPTGLRYCLNSAALRFIPKEDLEKEGYGKYRQLFEDKQ